jgi:TIR domain-containing protein
VVTTLRGRMSVFLGVRLLAEVSLQFLVTETPAPSKPAPVVEQARPYRRIFASYSHRDVRIAEQFEHYAAVFGDRYLRDWIDLRAGEKWSERLEELIRQADVFQLFWSWNSIRSENVRREWEYALGLGRPNFVRPTYWEFPMPNDPAHGLPPSALKALHFHRLAVDPLGPPPAPAAVAAAAAAAVSVDSRPEMDYPPKSPPPPPPAAATGSVDSLPGTKYAPMSPPPAPQSRGDGATRLPIVVLLIILAVTLLAFVAAPMLVGSPPP